MAFSPHRTCALGRELHLKQTFPCLDGKVSLPRKQMERFPQRATNISVGAGASTLMGHLARRCFGKSASWKLKNFLKPASFLEMICTPSARPKRSQGPDQLQSTPNPSGGTALARNHADARLSLRRFVVGGPVSRSFCFPYPHFRHRELPCRPFRPPAHLPFFPGCRVSRSRPEPQGGTLFEQLTAQ